jgi:hypothetical protein
MKQVIGCILAIAGWDLLYPPAIHRGSQESYTALSGWNIDGSYGSSADCDEAHYDDVNGAAGISAKLPRLPGNSSGPLRPI